MIRLLRFLITGSWHEHTWVIENELKTVCYPDKSDKFPSGYINIYVQKCTVCGKLKSFTVKR
jgi:hypothetical protein